MHLLNNQHPTIRVILHICPESLCDVEVPANGLMHSFLGRVSSAMRGGLGAYLIHCILTFGYTHLFQQPCGCEALAAVLGTPAAFAIGLLGPLTYPGIRIIVIIGIFIGVGFAGVAIVVVTVIAVTL